MIIYSIVPIEVVLQETDTRNYQKPIQVQYMNEMVEAIQDGDSGYTISRIISTSPKAYLKPELQPGQKIVQPDTKNLI